MIGDDLQFAATVQVVNIVLAAGYDEVEEGGEQVGYCWFEVSQDNGQTKDPFHDASTRKQIARSDEKQPGICILGTREILVSMTRGSAVYTYLSSDFGETWMYLDALP